MKTAASKLRSSVCRYDIIVEGTDNFPTPYLVNDACVLRQANIYGSIFALRGKASVFVAKRGPCYRCSIPTRLRRAGPSVCRGRRVGRAARRHRTIRHETIKLIIGQGQPLIGRLLLYDALEMRCPELKLRKIPMPGGRQHRR